MKAIKKEIAVMKKMNHQGIIKLFDVVYDEEKNILHFFMEYLSEGPLTPLSF